VKKLFPYSNENGILLISQVTGTIWSELDDTKLYTAMEPENIDKLFCAYQKNGVAVRISTAFLIISARLCIG